MMETILDKIRSILEDKMQEADLYFDDTYKAYMGILKNDISLSYGYFFDVRRKAGEDYYLLDISLSILQKEIAHISNQVQEKSIEKRDIPDQLKKKLLKNIKKKAPIIGGVYNWRDIDPFFQTAKVQNCYLYDSSEIDLYRDELITLFEKGQIWTPKACDWDFLVHWNVENKNALQALCILKYLNRKEDFDYIKELSISKYKAMKLPIDELENIEW